MSLQHRRALHHWATWYYLMELLGDAPTAPFDHRFAPFLQGLAHWNKRRKCDLLVTPRIGLALRRSSFLHFFSFFLSFYLDRVHDFPHTLIQSFKKSVSNSDT
ncbi:hypothetical protein H5410_027201 [Solanum commersonii]|uniref:Uncharacterized protein n=1 Tax=Solanum commersonii TaxID=4109 RepID=A0A9J5Z0M9_SOLCO|nr:hypothetical protein H5410_027201 [Solanum commersonii]